MDFEQARFNMIEQQIRPAGVLDPVTLETLALAHRERFAPPALAALAHADTGLPIGQGQCMLAPRIEAAMLQALGACRGARVLEIGTGSGCMAAMLATHAATVVSLEIEPALAEVARANLAAAGVGNVEVVVADGTAGWAAGAPYDVIIASGAVAAIPAAWREQLRPGGRLLAVVGSGAVQQARLLRREADGWQEQVVFETCVPPLHLGGPGARFSL